MDTTRNFSVSGNNSDASNDDDDLPTMVLFQGRVCKLQPVKDDMDIEVKDLPKVEIVTTTAVDVKGKSMKKKKLVESSPVRTSSPAPVRRKRSPSMSSSSSLSRSETPRRRAPPRQSEPEGMRPEDRPSVEREVYNGEVARIVDRNNFGFLKIFQNQEGCPYREMFFHRSTLKGDWEMQSLSKGDKVHVRYEVLKGRPQAWEVVLVGTADETPSPSPDRDWNEGFIARLNMDKQFGYIAPKEDIGYNTVWFHNSFIQNRISIRQLKIKDKVQFVWEKDPNHNGRVRATVVYVKSHAAKDRKRVYKSRSRSRSHGRSSPMRSRSRSRDSRRSPPRREFPRGHRRPRSRSR